MLIWLRFICIRILAGKNKVALNLDYFDPGEFYSGHVDVCAYNNKEIDRH